MRRQLRLAIGTSVTAAALITAPAVAEQASPAVAPPGSWVAGDLHVHSIYGHDTCITPRLAWDETSPDRAARTACEDPYTVGFSPLRRYQDAHARGLDFVALTDHNNVVNQTDPAAGEWLRDHPDFVAVPAYENSQPGHVQMIGARSCIGPTGPVSSTIQCDEVVPDRSAAGEQALADALRAAGGAFQVNHPNDGSWDAAFGHNVVPDTVEVWNIGTWAWQHPMPSSNDNDLSLRWYDGFLRAGHEVALTGGSDSHWVTTSGAQGVGTPTTWVFVRELSVAGLVEGLRAHRTSVSARPPALGGTQLHLEADGDGDGTFEAIAGSAVGPGSSYRVRLSDVAPGRLLRIVTDRGQTTVPLRAASTYTFRPGTDGVPHAQGFVRAEVMVRDLQAVRTQTCDPIVTRLGGTQCRNKLAMQALSSPIYVR